MGTRQALCKSECPAGQAARKGSRGRGARSGHREGRAWQGQGPGGHPVGKAQGSPDAAAPPSGQRAARGAATWATSRGSPTRWRRTWRRVPCGRTSATSSEVSPSRPHCLLAAGALFWVLLPEAASDPRPPHPHPHPPPATPFPALWPLSKCSRNWDSLIASPPSLRWAWDPRVRAFEQTSLGGLLVPQALAGACVQKGPPVGCLNAALLL